ncbi:MAG: hypothetical protein JSV92_03520 [archaeon]|nr:MAG: hypothetical protein JSV92_03520 [archaeon]
MKKTEVIYFNRQEGSHNYSDPSHSNVSFVTGIYNVLEDILICTEAQGASPASGPAITNNKELLKEVRLLKDGKVPDKVGVKYSNVKKANVDEDKIIKLMNDAKKLEESAQKYNSLMESLNSGYRELVLEINK